MSSIDLKHAYYTIPVSPRNRKFLRFVSGEIKCINSPAFQMGLASAPRIFTKLMKPASATYLY